MREVNTFAQWYNSVPIGFNRESSGPIEPDSNTLLHTFFLIV